MRIFGIDPHDVFESGALLADLQFAVAVGPLEIHVESVEVAARGKLLGNDQDAAARQAGSDTPQQRQPVLGSEELQDVVEDHHLCAVDFDVADIGLHPLDAVVELPNTARLSKHRGRTVDGEYAARGSSHGTQHGKRRRAQRTAEVVAAPALWKVPGGQQSGEGDDGLVTRHRAADHVREHVGDGLVEGKVDQLPRRSEQPVARRRRSRHGGRLFG